MKILMIHQYFKTPTDGGGIRSYHVAKGLVDRGHEVVVVTAHNRIEQTTMDVEGVIVHYLPIAYDNSFGFLKRVISFLRFTIRSMRVASQVPSVDIAYVITTPLSTAFVALFLKFFRGTPYLFEVGDLWPEVPVKMGILNNSLLRKAAYFLEKKAYQHAKGLIALSPGIAEYMAQKAPKQPICMVPNMSDLDYFQPSKTQEPGTISVLYCGAIGVANHLEYLLSAARESEQRALPVTFTIVGDGARKSEIKALAQPLGNVTVLDFVNRTELKKLIAQHDAFYVSFMNVPVLHTGSPNKFFDGLAAGKLMIMNLGGWLKELTEQHACGFAYDPEKPTEFVEKIAKYLEDPGSLDVAQQNSRKLAEEFSVRLSVDKLEGFMLGSTGFRNT